MEPLPSDPAAHLAATLAWLHPRGDEVFEIRLINPGSAVSPHWQGRAYGGAGGKAIVAGWFRDQAKAAAVLGEVRAEGVYVTLNPCQEALLARVHERLQANAKPTTGDADIAARRNLLLDFDPIRPTGISATDQEHETAILFARQVTADLAAAGWPAPLVADSGNGAHLVYAVELPNTPEAAALVKGCLGALAQRYAPGLAAAGLDLDQTVFNAARISKVYGTRTGKGDNLPERPHRYAKILELPERRSLVALEQLQALAVESVPAASGAKPEKSPPVAEEKGRFDLGGYLAHYGVEVVQVKAHGSSTLHCLGRCVFNPKHTANEAAVGQTADGKMFYQCFHNSCRDQGWAEARQVISGADKLGQFVAGGARPKARRHLRAVDAGASEGAQEPPPPAPATEGFSWSNLGNARRLVALYGRDLRYNYLNKEWYYWDGQVWRVDNAGLAVLWAKATVESIYEEAQGLEWGSEHRGKMVKFALRSESAGEIAGMLRLAQSEPGIPVLPEDFDSDPWLFNTVNGTIDLRTGGLRQHRREDLITCQSPVAYDPEAKCLEFERFLYQIMGDNIDLYTFLWASLGYALTGDCREQCFWIFWGSGANGKGTLLNVISSLFGNYWQNIAAETLLAKDNPGNQIRSDVAMLDGPRLVTAAEIDKGRRLSESLIKSLSGQDPITARFLYGKDFTFIPQFKLFIQSNNKPIIRDLTEGMWRRVKLVEFPMDFRANPDRELPARLAAERPGILAGLVKACLTWQSYGDLAEPDEVREAVQYYRDQMDPLKEFMEARCVVAPGATATAAELYRVYGAWAEEELQKRERLTKRMFGLALGEKGFRNGKGAAGVRLWRGIGLRETE